MSTVSQVRPSPANKYETFVEEQLGRARSRIRLLDLAVAGLGFLIVTLGYGLLMVVLDRLLDLPSLVRQAAFGLYLVAAVVYLGLTLGRVVFRRINPLYAAKQVEQALPGAKNSVVNYLDLRDQDLPAAIRGAVSHRAAKDLARADLDQAISTRRTGWLGGILGGLCLGLLVLFFLGPPQFFSLLRRAFAPFTETTIATRTQLSIMQPEGGNCTVAVGRAVSILASVFGHIPESNRSDSLRLLYRHQPNDPYTERPLERGDSRNEWGTTVAAAEVQTGFWYKVAGGDAETPEYRVQVRSNPLVETIEVKYHFRPYLNRPDQTTNDPNLEALRGTEVTLTARTNRAIREGHIELAGEAKPLAAEKVADEPQALRFKLTLDKDGTYRIWFTSQEGEHNAEPMPYTIRVKKDNSPRVEITKLDPAPVPAKKGVEAKDSEKVIELPANGLLQVEGVARDDYGVVGMKLRADGDVQFARTYREGKSFKLDNGNYPLKLDYKDFVDLGKINLSNGQPLRPGVEFECWLEATDNCDYPEANVGRSERFKVRIKETEKDPQKQQQQRQKAQDEQKKHNEKQDKDLQKESQERQQQQQQQQQQENQRQKQAADQSKENPRDQNGQNDKDNEKAGQNENQGANGKNSPKPEQNSDAKNGQENQPKEDKGAKNGQENQPKEDQGAEGQPKKERASDQAGKGQEKADKQTQDQADRLNNAIQQNEQERKKNGQENQNGQDNKTEKNNQNGQGNQSGQDGKAGEQNGQESKAGQQKGQENQAGQKGSEESKTGQQNGQQTKEEQKNKAGQLNGQDNKTGQRNGHDNKTGQQNNRDSKTGQQKGPENQAGQQNGQPNKGGQETKAGQKNAQDNKGAQSSGQENKGAQSSGQENKPEQKNGQENKTGQKDKAGQQTGQEDKVGQQNGQENKTGQQNGQEDKAGQRNSKGNKTGEENKAGQQNKTGQQKGEENKAGQEKKAGQQNGPEKKADQETKAGQKSQVGQENKTGQKNGQESKTGQENKTGQQNAQENKAGQKNKAGQPNGQEKNGSQQNGQEGKAGQNKDQENKPGQSNTKNGNKGQENGTGSQDSHNRKPSIDELIKALKNGNAKVREDAAKKLKNAKDTVKDPALKKAIEDALKEAKGSQSGQQSESGNRKDQSPAEPNGGTKTKQPEQNAQPSDMGNKTDQKNGPEGKAGQPNGQDKPSGEKNSQDNKGKNTPSGEDSKNQANQGKPDAKSPNPGGSSGGGGDRRGPATNSPDPSKGSEANPLYQQKAGELQLENFRKKVTKDVLKKANMTEEEYRKFLQAYEEMLKRKQPEPATKDDKLSDPKTHGGNLNSIGARRFDPKGKNDKVQRNGVALPPPEYRDAYKEFTEKLSDLERSGNKK